MSLYYTISRWNVARSHSRVTMVHHTRICDIFLSCQPQTTFSHVQLLDIFTVILKVFFYYSCKLIHEKCTLYNYFYYARRRGERKYLVRSWPKGILLLLLLLLYNYYKANCIKCSTRNVHFQIVSKHDKDLKFSQTMSLTKRKCIGFFCYNQINWYFLVSL